MLMRDTAVLDLEHRKKHMEDIGSSVHPCTTSWPSTLSLPTPNSSPSQTQLVRTRTLGSLHSRSPFASTSHHLARWCRFLISLASLPFPSERLSLGGSSSPVWPKSSSQTGSATGREGEPLRVWGGEEGGDGEEDILRQGPERRR